MKKKGNLKEEIINGIDGGVSVVLGGAIIGFFIDNVIDTTIVLVISFLSAFSVKKIFKIKGYLLYVIIFCLNLFSVALMKYIGYYYTTKRTFFDQFGSNVDMDIHFSSTNVLVMYFNNLVSVFGVKGLLYIILSLVASFIFVKIIELFD